MILSSLEEEVTSAWPGAKSSDVTVLGESVDSGIAIGICVLGSDGIWVSMLSVARSEVAGEEHATDAAGNDS